MLSNKKHRTYKTTTNVTLLLDMSGSMRSRRDETIREVNRYLGKLRADSPFYNITVVTFNEGTNTLIYRKPINGVGDLEHEEYRPNGWTCLLDAVGRTLDGYYSDSDERTLFCVITDDKRTIVGNIHFHKLET